MYLCVCLGVNDKAIKAAIEAGATTVEAVTELTCAGSECGSCRPEIASIIEAQLASGCPADCRPERRHLDVWRPDLRSEVADHPGPAAEDDQQSAA